jgi:uncharacterized membrane protein
MVIPLLLALGITVGMRTMTAMAVLCWFAWTGSVPQTGWSFWVGNLVTVIVFTVFAIGETIGDTLPSTPNRTALGPLAARVVFGGLVGGLGAHGILQPTAGGVLFGVMGALIGAYGGLRVRMWLAKWVGRDLPVALGESVLVLVAAVFVGLKLHAYLAVLGFVPRGRWML